ncbi:BatA domain-containing protein [Flavobacterium sp. W21_SRS_FM6]|uniref:BatA domain-containing protein n=1 Tax=Flavobacterium sp. W21_SRS_FM6 TaxID=3240268 RepID=UPI003F8F08DA
MFDWLSQPGWLQLANPWYLLTALATLIPIIIHLFNRYRARLIYFAPVTLLPQQKNQLRRQLTLHQRILLLLRVLICLLLAFFLAAPKLNHNREDKGLILVSQDWLQASSIEERQALASQAQHKKVALLDSPARIDLQQTLDSTQILNGPVASPVAPVNIWAKMSSYSSQLAAHESLTVYVTNRAAQFSGPSVPIAQAIEWHVKDLSAISKAIDKPHVTIAVYFEAQTAHSQRYLVGAINALKKQDRPDVTLDVRAIANLASQGGPVSATPSETLPSEDAPQQAQVIFWLSDSPVPDRLLKQINDSRRLILQAPGDGNAALWQSDLGLGLSGARLAIVPHISFPETRAKHRWHTTASQPLLSESEQQAGSIVQFYSRFEPRWSNALESVTLPLLLAEMMFPSADNTVEFYSAEYIQALGQSQNTAGALDLRSEQKAARSDSDLTWLIWLICLLFLAERLLSEKQSTSSSTQ